MANRGWEEDLRDIAQQDANILIEKDTEYGSSWKARGGVGAFMQGIARKWDRLEVQAKSHGYDIFAAIKSDTRPEGIRDDIGDLRRYLLLIEAEVKSWGAEPINISGSLVNREINIAAGIQARVGPYRGRPAVDHPAPYGYDRDADE